MGLSVTSNIVAMTAHRNLSTSQGQLERSLERLSSGYRINRAADDAAGLAISEGLRSQIRGMTQAVRNTRDGVSVVQTAEGALSESASILQRMRDLAVQAANAGGLDAGATVSIQEEIGQLKQELTRIADTTTFNGTALLDGTYRGTFQVGADVGDTLTVAIWGSMGASGLGVEGVNVTRTADPDVATYPAQGRVLDPDSGKLYFLGATTRAGAISWLSGTITLDGRTVDLGSVTETDTTGDGVIDYADAVAQLNAAASGAGITHRIDPFMNDGDDLIFRGPVPASGASSSDLTSATPTFTAASGAAPIPLYSVAAQTHDDPVAGRLLFQGSTAADIPTLRGSVSANGKTLELGSVSYADTSGDGTIDGDEALAQLNAAAKAAGITVDDHAFVESDFVTAGDDEYVNHGRSLYFRGAVPAASATADEVAAASPVFTQGRDAITAIDQAIRLVSTRRADLGAIQNRFEHTIGRLSVSIENTTAAESRIRDTDMALEMTRFARAQVMTQAGTAMLAQANQSTQNVLQLLNG